MPYLFFKSAESVYDIFFTGFLWIVALRFPGKFDLFQFELFICWEFELSWVEFSLIYLLLIDLFLLRSAKLL